MSDKQETESTRQSMFDDPDIRKAMENYVMGHAEIYRKYEKASKEFWKSLLDLPDRKTKKPRRKRNGTK